MSKEISFGKYKRVIESPTSRVYIKPYTKTNLTGDVLCSQTRVDVRVVNGEFIYKQGTVYNTVYDDELGCDLSIGRLIYLRENFTEWELKDYVPVEDLLFNGYKGKTRETKLSIITDDPFGLC